MNDQPPGKRLVRWSKPQDYSSHQEPAHGTYSGYVDGCRDHCCNSLAHRRQYARDYPDGIPTQDRRTPDPTAVPNPTGDIGDDSRIQ